MSFSFPLPFETRMQQQLGTEWSDFASVHTHPAPVSIRLNPYKISQPKEKRIPWTTQGYYLPERPNFTRDPLFHAGTYYVQEASSMFLEQVFTQHVDSSTPLRVLDLCAAPGGKSTHLLSLLPAHSLLISNEVIRSRAQILAENIVKWGCANVMVTQNDPENFQRLPGFFDVVVVDAPCSGEGLFRKDPQSMQEWSPEHATLCSQRQQRILKDIWPALKENGILVYSTCTYNSDENEHNLQWLAQQHKIEFLKIKTEPAWNIKEITSDIKGYQFFPHRVTGEGFFISAIRKTEVQPELKIRSGKNFTTATSRIKAEAGKWVQSPERFDMIRQHDLLIAIPTLQFEAMEFLSGNLHVVSKGTALAEIKHDKLIPEHALALSIHLNKQAITTIELSEAEALAYLRRESLSIPSSDRGFAAVTFQNTPIGWINRLGNRINNLYPVNWRIRMAG